MKNKAIIYGLGKAFQENRDYLFNKYDVVGLYDRDANKSERNISDVQEFQNMDYDYIVVTSVLNAWEIVRDLSSIGIPEDKIQIMCHEETHGYLYGIKPVVGVSYAGNFEDIVIADYYLKKGKKLSDVKYLELGVMDPVCASNTYYFYKNGASGILVEANPELINIIRKTRTRDIVINKAIYEEGDSVELYIGSDIGLTSVIEDHISLNEEWSGLTVRNKVKVPTISINDVFEEMYSKYNCCDLLSIDIEGYDLKALSAVNWKRYTPTVIIGEINQKNASDLENNKKIVDLLLSVGYVLYANNTYNAIFVRGNEK